MFCKQRSDDRPTLDQMRNNTTRHVSTMGSNNDRYETIACSTGKIDSLAQQPGLGADNMGALVKVAAVKMVRGRGGGKEEKVEKKKAGNKEDAKEEKK